MEENVQAALNALTYALRHSRRGKDIAYIDVADDEKHAVIHFEDRKQTVNIEGDSALSAIIDVCKALI